MLPNPPQPQGGCEPWVLAWCSSTLGALHPPWRRPCNSSAARKCSVSVSQRHLVQAQKREPSSKCVAKYTNPGDYTLHNNLTVRLCCWGLHVATKPNNKIGNYWNLTLLTAVGHRCLSHPPDYDHITSYDCFGSKKVWERSGYHGKRIIKTLGLWFVQFFVPRAHPSV